ncbi:MAG TPA: (d)CMP kinase [Acidimicrobiales bacterium]|nr:(d)CMP kinase [Acidimicrobiales bacterium]
MVVAIDGPVGSGKSTVAEAVAERLGLEHLGTGSMYRAVALAVLRRGLDPETASPDELVEVTSRTRIEVGERVLLDGEDVTDELRSPDVGRGVSAVAACGPLRDVLVGLQREWVAQRGGGVVEGRDIGTVVFPDADLKIFLTASDEERARRRSGDEDVEALRRRDRLDSSRSASPLSVAEGAVVIDSTDRSVEQVVDEIVRMVKPSPSAAPSPGQPSGAALLLYRLTRLAVVGICRTYWRATYEGLEHVPRSEAYVLAPVHRSFIDFGLVAKVDTRRIRYMGKDSLWKVGWFGRFITALGAFPVRRGAADREALRRCMDVIEGGEPLVLFPEGTRRSGPVVQELYEGAAYVAIRTGVPIVPVGIGGSERALPKGKRVPRPVKVHVIVGPPLTPPPPKASGHPSRSGLRELTDRLHTEVQRLFDEARRAVGDE